MNKIYSRPLSVGFAGETKTGKSHLAARFCKLNDQPSGIYLDFSRIFMKGGFTHTTPQYITAQNLPNEVNGDITIEVGEAFPACSTVGLDIDSQYRMITQWSDFEKVIDYAKLYQETIGRKKLWLILDDMVGLRWHKVIQISQDAKHKSVTKDDWKVVSTEIKLLISQLSKEFNLLMVNQFSDEYINQEKTGERSPTWIPGGAEYLYDGLFNLFIANVEGQPSAQYAQILAGRDIWQCDPNMQKMLKFPSPEDILNSLKISKDRW